jgi:hypothetical protein
MFYLKIEKIFQIKIMVSSSKSSIGTWAPVLLPCGLHPSRCFFPSGYSFVCMLPLWRHLCCGILSVYIGVAPCISGRCIKWSATWSGIVPTQQRKRSSTFLSCTGLQRDLSVFPCFIACMHFSLSIFNLLSNYKTYFPWIQVVKTICFFCRIGRRPNLWFHHSKAERCPGPVTLVGGASPMRNLNKNK